MGDMNTSLPQNITLQKNWHRQHPYNNRSVILYDFILDNNLCVGNFMFQQNLNYTYRKNGFMSYIDHVLISKYSSDKL